MKSKIVISSIVMFLMISTGVYSQTVNDVPIKDIDVMYVQLVGTGKLLSNKVTIEIDFGQETKFINTGKQQIKDNEGKIIEFNSMIDALNFMYENGYSFVSAYTISNSNQNVYHYILKKKEGKIE